MHVSKIYIYTVMYNVYIWAYIVTLYSTILYLIVKRIRTENFIVKKVVEVDFSFSWTKSFCQRVGIDGISKFSIEILLATPGECVGRWW